MRSVSIFILFFLAFSSVGQAVTQGEKPLLYDPPSKASLPSILHDHDLKEISIPLNWRVGSKRKRDSDINHTGENHQDDYKLEGQSQSLKSSLSNEKQSSVFLDFLYVSDVWGLILNLLSLNDIRAVLQVNKYFYHIVHTKQNKLNLQNEWVTIQPTHTKTLQAFREENLPPFMKLFRNFKILGFKDQLQTVILILSKLFSQVDSVERLQLDKNEYEDTQMQRIMPILLQARSLKELSLEGDTIRAPTLSVFHKALAEKNSPLSASLEMLSFNSSSIDKRAFPIFLETLPFFNKLTYLSLSDNILLKSALLLLRKFLKKLSPSKRTFLTTLQTLDLSNNELQDEEVKILSQDILPHFSGLRVLNLSDNDFSNKGLEHLLVAFQQLPLQTISIERMKFDKISIQKLPISIEIPSLPPSAEFLSREGH